MGVWSTYTHFVHWYYNNIAGLALGVALAALSLVALGGIYIYHNTSDNWDESKLFAWADETPELLALVGFGLVLFFIFATPISPFAIAGILPSVWFLFYCHRRAQRNVMRKQLKILRDMRDDYSVAFAFGKNSKGQTAEQVESRWRRSNDLYDILGRQRVYQEDGSTLIDKVDSAIEELEDAIR